MTVLSVFLVSFLVIVSCGGGGGGDAVFLPPAGTAFSDNFNSYTPANPWTTAGGWTPPSSGPWAIVNPGLSGYGLEFVGGGTEFLLSSYTGDDYTVTVRARSTAIAHGSGFGIFARNDNSDNCYAMVVFNKDPGPGNTIAIYKYWNNGANDNAPTAVDYLATDLVTSTYYTLTLKVATVPTGVEVTATVTDGVNSQTVTWTDDGSTFGVTIPSGRAGVWLYAMEPYPVIFDNFKVTAH
jgi:hypothetical protein